MSDFIQITSSKQDYLQSVTIAQQPEEVTPTITAVYLLTKEDMFLNPPDLAVSIAGIDFSGSPHKSSINVTSDGKILKTFTYINSTFKTLMQGFGQDILFISSPKSVYDAMEYDEDYVLVKWKESDNYNCGAWSVKTIIESIFDLIASKNEDFDKNVNIQIPDFDVSSPTVQYQAGSDFSQFIQGLLPKTGGLRYVWTFDKDNVPTVTLLATEAKKDIDVYSIAAQSISFEEEYYGKSQDGYNAWRFTGGMAKPVLSEYKYIKTYDVVEKTEQEITITDGEKTTIETTPPEGSGNTTTQIINSITPIRDNIKNTTIKETTRLYDFKGDEFHITKQAITTKGAVYDALNSNPQEGTISIEETVYDYENKDPLYFEKSRQTGSTKTKSGFITSIEQGISALSQANTSKGPVFFLMDDYTIISKQEYDDLWPDVGNILFGSYITFEDTIEKEQEIITYVHDKDSSRTYPEGTIKNNTSTKSILCFTVTVVVFNVTKTSRYYSTQEDGKSILQDIVSLVSDAKTTVTSNSPDASTDAIITINAPEMVNVEIYEKEIVEITAKGTYRWKETTKELDFETKIFTPTTRQVSIPGGRVPMEPTKYRKQQLQKDEGLMGQPELVIPFSAQIDTNNRDHFLNFVDLVKSKAQKTTNVLNIQGLSEPYFTGEKLLGGTVVGWSITASGDGQRQISADIEI